MTYGTYPWGRKGRHPKGVPEHKTGRLLKFKLSEVDEQVRAGGAAAERAH